MNLNGQCKIAFEAWYRNPLGTDEPRWTNWHQYGGLDIYNIDFFYMLPHEMQHGVKVKFFDSVGIHISIRPSVTWGYYFVITDCIENTPKSKTREEAEAASEQKANDLFNEQN